MDGRTGCKMKDQECDILLRVVGRQRDHSAFLELYRRHRKGAFSLSRYLLREPQEAEEAVQEAMIRVWSHASSYGQGSAKSWIMRIVARESFRIREKRQRRGKVEVSNAAGARIACPHSSDEDTEARDLNSALSRALDQLPDLDRQLVGLYYGGKISQDEIARRFRMPQASVSKRLDRARKNLRNTLVQSGFAELHAGLSVAKISAALYEGSDVPSALEHFPVDRLVMSQVSSRVPSLSKSNALFSLFLLGLGATVCACAAVAYSSTLPSTPSEKRSLVEKQAVSKRSSKSEDTQSKLFYKKWTFENGHARALPAFQNDWVQWKAPTGKQGAMVIAPKNKLVEVDLPIEVSARPHVLTIHCFLPTYQPPYKIMAEAFWKVSDPPIFFKPVKPTHEIDLSKIVIENYLIGNLIINARYPAISPYALKYSKAYPSSKIALRVAGVGVESVEIKEIQESEIPEWVWKISALAK